ncbi:MAG: AAA-like domain protein [candidate division CPR1 bacterium ADurb.Bin160]|jgi:type IV secretory pathway TraG/TraD family ATPase VirD4|uniref:AAA-like domain protein n=1 Tax=candidate division CPR1 bacterium ADurb.Bin160 TaxID=1852826 RepID=A0A1V5ZMG2_9BACT|nr:MAG: AAA-like domain protein [candidate division CPR1 bacterium ADurb.Bin160]
MIGSLLVTKIQIDAMSRADIAREDRRDFYLYIDEFQNFATKAFATILSEARKYRLSLIIANQFTAQLQEEVRDAIFGNVGTIMAFTL